MSKDKNPKKGKVGNIWSVQGLEKRCSELIHEGVLLKKGGLAKIRDIINAEFAEQLSDGLKLRQHVLKARLSKIVWTPKIEGDLWSAISNKLEQKFREAYAYIPESMVRTKTKFLKGLTHSSQVAEFKAGMGRLSTDELPRDAGSFEFPRITYKDPFLIKAPAEWQMPIINGALIGITYTDINRNPMRRALADARKRGAAAVVLTNLIELDTKKTGGPIKVYRAMVSGLHLNPERFPEEYRQEVKDILSGKVTDKLIYQTLAEKFVEILDGLHKIAHRPNGKGPEFTGPVYVLLGIKEEELINATAYFECRYMTIVEQKRIEAELNMASHKLTEAKAEQDYDGIEKWNKEVARLSRKRARTIITNIGDSQYEFYRRQMRALVVKKFEETIPNCKVISQGSTHLKVNDKIIKIHVPPHDQVTDSLLANAGDNYGIDVFRDTLADLTVVCHPYSLNHRDVGREDSKDGLPVTKFIHVAPSCLDGEFLRDELRDTTKAVHPVQKLVFNPQFKPGILLLSCMNGMLNADLFPVAKLDRCDEVKDVRNFAFPYPKTKYITFKLTTDNHYGSIAKRYIWDPKERINLGTDEAANEMMRREGILNPGDIRIHGMNEMDDVTNGDLWFKPRYRPDPQEMSVIQIERWLRQMTADVQRAAEKGDHKAVLQLTEEINRVSIAQLYFKGEDFPFHQMMQVYDRHIDPQIDFYSAVLGRFEKSGLKIRGISKINKSMSDTRDVGVINFPNGNHRLSTTDQTDLEGEYFARHLQARLGKLPEWQDKDAFLREAIRAPRFGNVTFGWGTIQAPGGYPWGVRVHGSPARQSGWSDILASVIKNDIARGDDSYGLGKYVTITFYGDKHFYAKAETDRNIYVMCAASVHTDTYGSSGGFPPNNTGVCFVSLPADGPDAGPILVRPLPHDFMRDWFANPKPFNWDKFLPEPV